MSIFSGIKHGFEHLGHDIASAAKTVGKGLETAGKDVEKVGKGIAEGVEMVGKTLATDALNTAEATLQSADALIHGHLQLALNKATQAGEDLWKTSYDMSTAGTQATVDSLAHMHISKKMDKAMGKLEKGFNTMKSTVVKSVDQVATQVVNDEEGAVTGKVRAVEDVLHGKWGAATREYGKSMMDALNVAADVTPEGAAAAIGTQVLMNAHIGNEQIDSAIGGALHGNVTQMAKGIVKNVAEAELGNKVKEKASELASKEMPQGGSGQSDALLGVGLSIAADAAGGSSKRSRGGAGDSSHSYSTTKHPGKTSSHSTEPETTDSPETKKQKKEDASDNAQNAANNTANNATTQPGGDSQLEQELMLESFLMQAGMSHRDGAAKRRAELSGDS
jgi:hypothetical protein